LLGGVGDDTLDGGPGGNADTLDGGAGDTDTAFYGNAVTPVSVDLGARTGVGGDAAGDSLLNIENLVGGMADDLLVGDAAANTLRGGIGADTLQGGGSGDVLDGGAGDTDTAFYGNAVTPVSVDLGARTGVGGDASGDSLSNIENLVGGMADDLLSGDTATNTLRGGMGADILRGGGGGDLLDGGGGDADLVSYDGFTTAVSVDLGMNKGTGGAALGDRFLGVENIDGTSLADSLVGDDMSNRLRGGEGNDVLDGGPGAAADTLDGSSGRDQVSHAGSTASLTVDLGSGAA